MFTVFCFCEALKNLFFFSVDSSYRVVAVRPLLRNYFSLIMFISYDHLSVLNVLYRLLLLTAMSLKMKLMYFDCKNYVLMRRYTNKNSFP